MGNDYYMLHGTVVVHVVDHGQWAQWWETANRSVAHTFIGEHEVSTVFLGLNHQFGQGPPLLFETMVFAADNTAEDYCHRTATWEEAVYGHYACCADIHLRFLRPTATPS